MGGFAQRSKKRNWIIAFVAVGSLGIAAYQQWNEIPDAPVIGHASVVDGDTIRIADYRIRLVDIDAPEREQTCEDAQSRPWPCGAAASNELRNYLQGQTLHCLRRGFDQYARLLAVCSLPDGSDVNAWIVAQGWAVTSGYAKVYRAQESEARAAKRGIWSGSFISPAQWRKQHQGQE